MNAPNTKKLIAAFLVLSIATSWSIIALTSWSLIRRSAAPPPVALNTLQPETPPQAFVESPPFPPEQTPSATAPATAASSTLNLTDRLAKGLADEIVAANSDPNQALLVGDGQGFVAPTLDSALTHLDLSDAEMNAILGPRLRKVNAPPKVQVLDTYTQADLDAYVAGVKDATQALQQIDTALLGQSNDPRIAKPIALLMDEAEGKVYNLPTPRPFAEFQGALLSALGHGQRAASTDFAGGTDPLLDITSLNAELEGLDTALTDLADANQKLLELTKTAQGDDALTPLASAVRSLLGIKTAHAIFVPVFDPALVAAIAALTGVDAAGHTASFLQQLKDFLLRVATEWLKEVLVHRLVEQTIRWIQGGGKPQFVTDWQGFLLDSAKLGADRLLTELVPELCTSFGPLLRVSFQGVALRNPPLPTCTIDKVVRNVQAFANDFKTGGWIAYSASLSPTSNAFGAAVQTGELLSLEAGKEREGAKSDAQSSEGFNSSKTCAEYGPKSVDPEGFYVRGPCIRWENTTPGGILSRITSDAFYAPLGRIVNANDLAALASALIQAALTKLVGLAKDSVSGGILALDPHANIDTSEAVGACDGITDPATREQCIDQMTAGLTGVIASSTSAEFCDGTTGSQFQGAVAAAINSYSAAHPGVMAADTGCNPNWRVTGSADDYLAGVASAINASGLTALGGADEISVKRDNSCSEQFDILTSSNCANAKFLYGISPAEF